MLVDIPFILMGAFVFLFAPWRWSTFGGKLKLGDSEYAKTECAAERRETAYVQVHAACRVRWLSWSLRTRLRALHSSIPLCWFWFSRDIMSAALDARPAVSVRFR